MITVLTDVETEMGLTLEPDKRRSKLRDTFFNVFKLLHSKQDDFLRIQFEEREAHLHNVLSAAS
jgi:hypothetical protein